MAKEITRYIKSEVERELWARASGRCQFQGCNRLLYKSPVTQEKVNISEKAHIYSFSKDGPRGWGPLITNKKELNKVPNLMLVCHDCHKKIDQDKEGQRYSADLLQNWKEAHETRVRIVTGISPNKKSHFVLYGSKIGDEQSPLQSDVTAEAMFPDWYPAEERPVNLSMFCAHDDSAPDFWATEAAHLRKEFERKIRVRIEEAQPNHFSVFALAPQPLLVLLGSLFTDKVPAIVYQLHREPKTWKWQSHPDNFNFKVHEPSDKSGAPILVVSLSAKIGYERIKSVLNNKLAVWELTIDDCHNDFLRSEAQLSMFREAVRKLMVEIGKAHGKSTPLSIFPAMPVACAVEFGRVRMPKADMPWVFYDHNNKNKGFIRALEIG